jgi:hypothetical protein
LKAALLALALLVSAGSAAATRLAPTPLTAEALLAADVPEQTVQKVAGGNWWPNPPAFDTVVFQSDPQPKLTSGVTFEQVGGHSTIVTTLYAFRSADQSLKFLLYAELVGPPVDEKNPTVGDRRAYYTTTLPDGRPATRLFFTRGRVGVAIEVNGESWSAARVAGIAQPIDAGVRGLLDGSLRPPSIPAAQLALMPAPAAAPGPLLGTAPISQRAWATVDRDGTPGQIRDRLAQRGATLLFRRYLRQGSPTDVIETTLFTFPGAGAATAWFAPFGAGVRAGQGSLDPGGTGPHAAYRHGRDNYELRFAAGRYVGDVFCYAPFVQQPSPACEGAVRTLASRWYAQLSHAK